MNYLYIYFYSFLLYFFGFVISLLIPMQSIELDSIFLFILGFLAIPIGLIGANFFCTIAMNISSKPTKKFLLINPQKRILKRLINRVNFFGALGCIFVLIDRFFIRGIPLNANFIEARNILENSSTSLMGLGGNFLSGFAVFSIGLMLLYNSVFGRVSFWSKLTCFIVTSLFIFSQAMLGSRSGILLVLMTSSFFYFWGQYRKSLPLFNRDFIKYFVILIIFILGMSMIFLARLEAVEMTVLYSILFSGYGYTIQPSESYLQFISELGKFENILLSLTSVLMYVYHGMFEFFILVRDFEGQHAYGEVTFWFPLKIFETIGFDLGVVNIEELEGVRPGVFTTFLGPLFIDFGYFMPLVVFGIFLALGIPAMTLNKNSLFILPYASIFISTIILSPVFNLLTSATGVYPFIASLFIPLLSKKFTI